MTTAAPAAVGFHRYSHNLQQNPTCLPRSFAADHVLPPSTDTSTDTTSDSPAQAAPWMRYSLPAGIDSPAIGRAIDALTSISVMGVRLSRPSSPVVQMA